MYIHIYVVLATAGGPVARVVVPVAASRAANTSA